MRSQSVGDSTRPNLAEYSQKWVDPKSVGLPLGLPYEPLAGPTCDMAVTISWEKSLCPGASLDPGWWPWLKEWGPKKSVVILLVAMRMCF